MDQSRLSEIFEEHLVCSKCNLIIDNPFEIICCGTLFCESCTVYDTRSNNCTGCDKPAVYQPNSFIKRMINQMSINCIFKCGTKLQSFQIKEHMSSCELREYNCNFCKEEDPDKFKGKRREFLVHLITSHDSQVLEMNSTVFKNRMVRETAYHQGLLSSNKPNLEEEKESMASTNLISFPLSNAYTHSSTRGFRANFPGIPHYRVPSYIQNSSFDRNAQNSLTDESIDY